MRHAVLTDKYIVTLTFDRKQCKYDFNRLNTVFDLYEDCKTILPSDPITHIWVMPGSKFETLGYDAWSEKPLYTTFLTKDVNGDKWPMPRAGRVSQRSRDLCIMYPGQAFNMWTIAIPLDILATLEYLQKALGITVAWSPGNIANSLLNHLLNEPHHQKWLTRSEEDLNKLPFHGSAIDLRYKRPFTKSDIGKYLHQVDKNSAYLAACQSVRLGCGTPIHVDADTDITRCGIYHVTNVCRPFGNANFTSWNENLPDIIRPGQEWVQSDILRYANEQGYTFDIVEAWVFEEDHQLLRKWAKTIWDNRLNFKTNTTDWIYGPARNNAHVTMKEMAVVGGGRFAMPIDHKSSHKNWWFDIVGSSYTNGLRNIVNFQVVSGLVPRMVNNDAFWYVTDSPEICHAIPGVLDRSVGLGGFKLEYTLKLTEEIVTKCDTLKGSKVLDYLAKCVEEQN